MDQCLHNDDSNSVTKLKGLHIAHLNCRSLVKHIDELRLLLAGSKIDILSLNETRLSHDIPDSEVELPGFSLVRCDRNRDGGGVLLAINNRINFTKPLHDSNNKIEAVSVKIFLGTKTLVVSSIYRPPSADVSYHNNIIEYMEKVASSASDMVFMGDFNLNVLNSGPDLRKVAHICDLLDLKQFVTKPTRVTQTSSTIIDLLFSNIGDKHLFSDVVPVTISDHFLVYGVLNFRFKHKGSRIIHSRNFSYFEKAKFIDDLTNSSKLKAVTKTKNVEEAWKIFYDEFMRICNIHAPVRQRKVKTRCKPSPWLSHDIVKLIHKRNVLHKRAAKSKHQADWVLYKKARNDVIYAVRNCKRVYFAREIKLNSGNKKNIWKLLKQVLPSSKTPCNIPSSMTADDFNSFFTSVGEKLTNGFNSNHLPDIFVDRPSCSFTFSHISSNFVYKSLSSLPNNMVSDVLNFDNFLLKTASPVISDCLCYLFNQCFFSSTFPNDWKKALVTPIYKGKGKSNDPSNYRPISITSTISKIFESAIKKQVIEYLKVNNLISSHQSAYLSGRSKQTALHTVVDELSKNIDHGYISVICAVDMAKGFDTICHNVLLHKLSFYGFNQNSVNFFRSYLSNRCQKVKLDNGISSDMPIKIGVPQGSILGPLLYLIYVNDLYR